MQKKSNFWLIVIVIVVLLALLWPVLRRSKTSTEVTPNGEATTTSETATTFDDTSLDLSNPDTLIPSADNTTLTIPGSVSTPVPSSTRAPATLSLKVFFSNQKRNPTAWQCSTVYPVVRTVVWTPAVARAALTELIKGPKPTDLSAGFFTALSPRLTIKQLLINNGVAHVDFGQNLVSVTTGNTTCLKEQIRAQITETLKQFLTVRSVIISTNGVLF